MKCSCYMHTALRLTGWSWPHANWRCPTCGKEYWQRSKKEKVTPEKPFACPEKESKQ